MGHGTSTIDLPEDQRERAEVHRPQQDARGEQSNAVELAGGPDDLNDQVCQGACSFHCGEQQEPARDHALHAGPPLRFESRQHGKQHHGRVGNPMRQQSQLRRQRGQQ